MQQPARAPSSPPRHDSALIKPTSTTPAPATKIADRITLQDVLIRSIAHARAADPNALHSWTVDMSDLADRQRRQTDVLIDLFAATSCSVVVDIYQPSARGAKLAGSPGVQVKQRGQLVPIATAASIIGSRGVISRNQRRLPVDDVRVREKLASDILDLISETVHGTALPAVTLQFSTGSVTVWNPFVKTGDSCVGVNEEGVTAVLRAKRRARKTLADLPSPTPDSALGEGGNDDLSDLSDEEDAESAHLSIEVHMPLNASIAAAHGPLAPSSAQFPVPARTRSNAVRDDVVPRARLPVKRATSDGDASPLTRLPAKRVARDNMVPLTRLPAKRARQEASPSLPTTQTRSNRSLSHDPITPATPVKNEPSSTSSSSSSSRTLLTDPPRVPSPVTESWIRPEYKRAAAATALLLDFPKPMRRVAWDLAHMPDAWSFDDIVSCAQYVYGAISGAVVPADQIPLGPVPRSDVHRSDEEVEAALARLEVAASWPGLAPAKRRQFFEWAVVLAGTPEQFLDWIVELEEMDGEGRP